jgi:hypothetical protein
MPAYNRNVYQRMQKRGADFTDPRVMRRLGNRSFQANQGTLAKGQWTNKDQMRAQWPQQQPQRQFAPPGPGSGGVGDGGRPGPDRQEPTFSAKGAATPKWKQQKANAAQFGGNAMARPQMPFPTNPQGGKVAPAMGGKG